MPEVCPYRKGLDHLFGVSNGKHNGNAGGVRGRPVHSGDANLDAPPSGLGRRVGLEY